MEQNIWFTNGFLFGKYVRLYFQGKPHKQSIDSKYYIALQSVKFSGRSFDELNVSPILTQFYTSIQSKLLHFSKEDQIQQEQKPKVEKEEFILFLKDILDLKVNPKDLIWKFGENYTVGQYLFDSQQHLFCPEFEESIWKEYIDAQDSISVSTPTWLLDLFVCYFSYLFKQIGYPSD